MRRFVEGADRGQNTLFPECLEDWIGEDNPVRVIDVFVDELDLAELGFGGVDPEITGRPSYHPSVLLKLYIYGYLNRLQSSRRLEREAGRNVEVMWLTGRLAPDHKTIADLRKDNGRAIRQVCARFVALCRTLGLLTQASVAIDGSKFKAVNNRDKNFTRAKMERRMAQIEESVARYLQQLDTADRQEPSEALKTKTSRLKEKIAKLKEQMQRLAVLKVQMLAAPNQQISPTDPDARSMATSGRGSGVVGYNVQIAVDTTHHLIVTHEVTNVGADRSQLSPVAKEAEATLLCKPTVQPCFPGRKFLISQPALHAHAELIVAVGEGNATTRFHHGNCWISSCVATLRARNSRAESGGWGLSHVGTRNFMRLCSRAFRNSGTRRAVTWSSSADTQGNRTERFQEFAAEMVRLKVDIIIVVTTPAALAVKSATTTIPVVFPNAINPVETGVVASLAHPGGNVTGGAPSVGTALSR